MHTLAQLQQIIATAFGELTFPAEPAKLYDPVRYTLGLGGKRIRPLLALAGCDLFGGDLKDAIHPAIGLELFHNFTLLHDDIMDQAPLRRGKETVYKKWNTNIAILSGDTLFAVANRYVLHTRQEAVQQVAELFNKTAIEVCEGQQYDMDFESADSVTIPQYMEMIRLKTAVLLAASLKTGAVTGGATDKDADLLYAFGIHTGLAFQLRDDLLDVFGDKETFGKVTGGDIVSGKKTFLYLKALELSGNEQEAFRKLYTSSDLDPAVKINRVKEVFHSLDIEQVAQQEAEKHYALAMDSLDSLGLDEHRIALLKDLGNRMVFRSF